MSFYALRRALFTKNSNKILFRYYGRYSAETTRVEKKKDEQKQKQKKCGRMLKGRKFIDVIVSIIHHAYQHNAHHPDVCSRWLNVKINANSRIIYAG